MDINHPFLNRQMRVTIAGLFNLTPCERGCLDTEGLTVTDFQLMAQFFHGFGAGADVTTALRHLNETLPLIPIADPISCMTFNETKGAAAIIDQMGN